MRLYKVAVSGRNYLLPCDGEPRKVGFSQTFYLRAATMEQASQEAKGRVTRDPALVQNALNGPEDPFCIIVESVNRVGPLYLLGARTGKRHFFLEKGELDGDGEETGNHCQHA